MGRHPDHSAEASTGWEVAKDLHQPTNTLQPWTSDVRLTCGSWCTVGLPDNRGGLDRDGEAELPRMRDLQIMKDNFFFFFDLESPKMM